MPKVLIQFSSKSELALRHWYQYSPGFSSTPNRNAELRWSSPSYYSAVQPNITSSYTSRVFCLQIFSKTSFLNFVFEPSLYYLILPISPVFFLPKLLLVDSELPVLLNACSLGRQAGEGKS